MRDRNQSAQLLANVATAIGIIFVAWQLYLTRRQVTAAFEQAFVEKYERIVASIPLAALLGEQAEPGPADQDLRPFFDYFELCEEELYYRHVRKVSRSTWRDWEEGIVLNFRRPAFQSAWRQLSERVELTVAAPSAVRVEQFTLLRRAVESFGRGESFDPVRG